MRSALLLLCLGFFGSVLAQADAFWSELSDDLPVSRTELAALSPATEYKALTLEEVALKAYLSNVPEEGSIGAQTNRAGFPIQLADGKVERFRLTSYRMMEPALEAQFPEFKTYYGYSETDATRRIRLDLTASGLNAMLFFPEGNAFVRPVNIGAATYYLSYFERDVPAPTEPFECGTSEHWPIGDKLIDDKNNDDNARAGDCQLRTYRLAVAVTGEYATQTLTASGNGNASDDAIVTSHIVTNINQINGWYERDATVRLILIANLTDIFYYNGSTDPYTNSNSSTMLNENNNNLNLVIGAANFDIGHVLGNGGGSSGVAQLSAVCGSGKGRGVTKASATGITRPRFIKVWAHEMGHQFGAGHTQNENCQRSGASAMEPGAGTTIMSYATSSCANQIQNVPDYYFHAVSIQQITARTNSTSCAAILPSSNSQPTVSAGIDHSVPKSTPLLLKAVASDPDNDPLTYTWEQYDNEAADAIPPLPSNVFGPNFRSLPPSTESNRYLPNLNAVIAGTTPTWEVLPGVARDMTFRVTVRDNSTNSISCTAEDDVTITTVANGPFVVTSPNTATDVWFETAQATVTWDVAGTNAAPVSCANVDILLSYDSGQTYTTTLATSVPNVGTADITVPQALSTTARVMIRCSDNIFYNISQSDFEIQPFSATYTLQLAPNQSAICPSDQVSINVNTTSINGFNSPISLSVLNLPGAASASFATQNVTPGNSTVLTLSNTSSITPATYNLLVRGTGAGIEREEVYTLTVQDDNIVLALNEPIDGAIDLSTRPILSWNENSEVTIYQLQIATNPSFSAVVVDVLTANNEAEPQNNLQDVTTYFWRVRGSVSPCGVMPWSNTNSFTTAQCLPPVAQNTSVPIPASGTPTITSVLNMTQMGTVQNLKVTNINGTHTYMSDLEVRLIAPGGSPTVVLWNRLCSNSDDFNLSLSDDASTGVNNASCNPLGGGGTFKPVGSLSNFNGLPIAGDWTLQISDVFAQDGGSLNGWSLEFCTEASVPLPVELYSFSGWHVQGNGNLLTWTTASEVNNDKFVVESSRDGVAFRQNGTRLAGNNPDEQQAYDYLDRRALPGLTYYRLQQLDFDGTSSYSDVIAITALGGASSADLQAYFDGQSLQLTSASMLEEVALIDIAGRILQTWSGVDLQNQTLQISTYLAQGIYTVRAKDLSGKVQVVRAARF